MPPDMTGAEPAATVIVLQVKPPRRAPCPVEHGRRNDMPPP